MKKIITVACLLILFGCHQRKHHYKEKVNCYKTHSVDNNGNDVWLYYYLFWANNNTQCYYYSSPTQVSSFSNTNWQSSNTSPVSGMSENQVEQMPSQEVSTQEMSTEIQSEMESNPENFEGMTQDQMGDYEGGGSYDASDNNSGDSGSDGGGSDSGGGDSGGGGGE